MSVVTAEQVREANIPVKRLIWIAAWHDRAVRKARSKHEAQHHAGIVAQLRATIRALGGAA